MTISLSQKCNVTILLNSMHLIVTRLFISYSIRSTYQHAMIKNELNHILLYLHQETFTRMVHQRNDKLQDPRNIVENIVISWILKFNIWKLQVSSVFDTIL